MPLAKRRMLDRVYVRKARVNARSERECECACQGVGPFRYRYLDRSAVVMRRIFILTLAGLVVCGFGGSLQAAGAATNAPAKGTPSKERGLPFHGNIAAV